MSYKTTFYLKHAYRKIIFSLAHHMNIYISSLSNQMSPIINLKITDFTVYNYKTYHLFLPVKSLSK